MEKSAWTVGRTKFTRLPSAAQHRLLAWLASDALRAAGAGNPEIGDTFLQRYGELQSWAELDRYRPPSWLSSREALDEYGYFHRLLGAPAECEGPLEDGGGALSWQPRFPVTVALDQVRSPYNVGSVLRLVDNLGLKGLVHASPWLRLDHPRLRRAARGCQQWIPVRCQEDLPSYLSQAGCAVVGVESDGTGTPLQYWQPPEEGVLVLGNETYGLAKAVRRCCTETVFVPMQGYKRSMNVHHALALVAWHMVSSSATQRSEDLG